VTIPLRNKFKEIINRMSYSKKFDKPYFIVSSKIVFSDNVWWETDIELFSKYTEKALSYNFKDYKKIKEMFTIKEYEQETIDIDSLF
jgi:hypothetical protein